MAPSSLDMAGSCIPHCSSSSFWVAMRGRAPHTAAACWTAAVLLVMLFLPPGSMTCWHTASISGWCAGVCHACQAGAILGQQCRQGQASYSRGPGLADRSAAGAPTLYLGAQTAVCATVCRRHGGGTGARPPYMARFRGCQNIVNMVVGISHLTCVPAAAAAAAAVWPDMSRHVLCCRPVLLLPRIRPVPLSLTSPSMVCSRCWARASCPSSQWW